MTSGMEGAGITKSYGDNLVLDGADIVVGPGEVVALSSPSGGGKTTLLNILAGLTSPSSGIVRIEGRDFTAMTEDARSVRRLSRLGVMHQSSYLFPWLSVEENLAVIPAKRRPGHWFAELRRELGIDAFSGTAVNRLSGGQRRRVCLARTLRNQPRALILDEPTAGLDEALAVAVRRALRDAASRGSAVLVATHDPGTTAMADRVVVLSEGKVHA